MLPFGFELPLMTPALIFIVKATLLLVLALGASLVLRRASAGSRHLVWLVVLGTLIVLPGLAAWRPLTLPALPSAPRVAAGTIVSFDSVLTSAGTPAGSNAASLPEVVRQAAGTDASRAGTSTQWGAAQWGLAIAAVWGVIALGLVAWLLYGAFA